MLKILRILSLASIIGCFFIASSIAQSNEDCFACHGDKSATMSKNGMEISVYVDAKDYDNSVHKDLGCVDCHAGLDPNNIPHKEKIERVNCLQCHEVREDKESIHFSALHKGTPNAPQCYDCHTKHSIKRAESIRSDIVACVRCHDTKGITQYKDSPHAKVGIGSRLSAGCSDCHGYGHNIGSAKQKTEIQRACISCHSQASVSYERSVHGGTLRSGNKNAPGCTDCHGGHQILGSKYLIESRACVKCHLDVTKFANIGPQKPSVEFIREYQNSIHGSGRKEGKSIVTCVDCHGSHEIQPASDSTSSVTRERIPATCGKCHQDEAKEYSKSDHGKALASGVKDAPVCTDCHSEHSIHSITNTSSPVSRTREDGVCLRCHLDNPNVRDRVGPSAQFIGSYEKSVHSAALKNGNIMAATCSDCHGGHSMRKAGDPTSSVNKINVSKTCGSRNCHSGITATFNGSIHGEALISGNLDSPTCTNCHGQHQILNVDNPDSPVAKANLAVQVCSPCHSSVQMAEKYGFSSDKYNSYSDSYHGLAVKGGSTVAANCASCHGLHDIKPSGDPTSTISKSNLVKTCGKCHPGANENFTRGSVHVIASAEKHPLIYWITTSYMLIIVTLVGGMFLHNVLDFLTKSKKKLSKRRRPGYEVYGSGLYLRMTLCERFQHGSLLLSFVVLVVTGLMLKFPDAWWVKGIREFLGDGVFEVRGLLHRIAAVVMVGAALYHVFYIFFVPRGKQLVRDLVPKVQDVKDAIAVLRYNLGISKAKPLFGRFSYIEKSEYWALVWGTVVMAATGIVLWFDNMFLGLSSKLFLDVATTVHYYEAWLATLAIIVWHIYFVIFNPDVYPMNLAWLKGTITEEEMEEEHPLELDKIKQEAMEQEAQKNESETVQVEEELFEG